MTEFTPYSALIGGAIIGIAAILLLLLLGKIAGISGIFAHTFSRYPIQSSWQLFFILGLIAGPMIAAFFGFSLPNEINVQWSHVIIGGFLVGFGSRYGSGCTSGHGICGIGRLSKRSIVATVVFMITAAITVFVTRHMVGG
ncbi:MULTISPECIES: YeeE/YedE family protein [unclassified Thalassotalea]|uniref:YeeE/YedE family protein n=1 Tax=unclassified Thalassotalea TaxID=2614972 RepID=UPI001080AFD4|nr:MULTISPECIES: YeeE/YedE family protein [unclassified Thalassotalea]NMP15618.1 YeeE/YedE family protein [Thalassotalea sp. Y01]QBY05736.1 YeeE/YedE family protein [Thalassotalea sp. HSM 43]